MSIVFACHDYLRRPVFTAQRHPFGKKMAKELIQLLGLGFILAFTSSVIVNTLYVAIEGQSPTLAKGVVESRKNLAVYFWSAIIIFGAPL
jgi:divalent metal cation (Fe/Co/Zn/Cd) transporter